MQRPEIKANTFLQIPQPVQRISTIGEDFGNKSIPIHFPEIIHKRFPVTDYPPVVCIATLHHAFPVFTTDIFITSELPAMPEKPGRFPGNEKIVFFITQGVFCTVSYIAEHIRSRVYPDPHFFKWRITVPDATAMFRAIYNSRKLGYPVPVCLSIFMKVLSGAGRAVAQILACRNILTFAHHPAHSPFHARFRYTAPNGFLHLPV